LLPGLYVLIDRHIQNVWRLFKDIYSTFMTTFLSGLFQEILLNCIDDSFPSVAVPLRVRYEDKACSSIEGWCVAVKDNYHISGIQTSLCNRVYRQTFSPLLQTADCIQKLVGLGVVIVDKTKLNPFGVWVEPTEYVDYQAPWNLCADRYQSPGGSSTGSAAAVAVYNWLDIALGTDSKEAAL
jgi:Asp-tRNA(Asn)/Glu-tRNA(Gln) amidotransferase A subunit family amidase